MNGKAMKALGGQILKNSHTRVFRAPLISLRPFKPGLTIHTLFIQPYLLCTLIVRRH